jgi:hypothetical protein
LRKHPNRSVHDGVDGFSLVQSFTSKHWARQTCISAFAGAVPGSNHSVILTSRSSDLIPKLIERFTTVAAYGEALRWRIDL